MKEKKQAPDVFSSDLPLTHVNRYHLSNVKDLKSSANRPLLLGCGVFGRCYKMYYRGMSVAVKQFNKHLSTEFDVIKEASLVKQLVHPCFPFVYGICTESKPFLFVSKAVLQCGVESIHPLLNKIFEGSDVHNLHMGSTDNATQLDSF